MCGKTGPYAGRLRWVVQVCAVINRLKLRARSSNGISKEALKNRKEDVLRLELFFNEVNCLPHLAQFTNLTQVVFFGTGTYAIDRSQAHHPLCRHFSHGKNRFQLEPERALAVRVTPQAHPQTGQLRGAPSFVHLREHDLSGGKFGSSYAARILIPSSKSVDFDEGLWEAHGAQWFEYWSERHKM